MALCAVSRVMRTAELALLFPLHDHPFCRLLSRAGAEYFAMSDAEMGVYTFLLQKKRKR